MKADVVRGDYERARRKGFIRAIGSWLRRSDNALLAFDEMRRGIHAHAQRDGGLREVPIDQIVGSVGRYATRSRVPPRAGPGTAGRVDRAYRDGRGAHDRAYKIGEVYS